MYRSILVEELSPKVKLSVYWSISILSSPVVMSFGSRATLG